MTKIDLVVVGVQFNVKPQIYFYLIKSHAVNFSTIQI